MTTLELWLIPTLGNTAESYFLDNMFELVDEAYGDAFLDDETKDISW
ncbi:MAG: hypothetical protein ACJZ6A_08560 [Candidatus Poseidoniaceae archaeon]